MSLGLALAESLKFGLNIVNTKTSRKYLDRVIKLELMIEEEEGKDESICDFGLIDKCERELCIITRNLYKTRK